MIDEVAGSTLCPTDDHPGYITISARLTPHQQAKTLLHEVVHVAEHCDHRSLDVEERIAQDVSDLLDSSEGSFVLDGLKR